MGKIIICTLLLFTMTGCAPEEVVFVGREIETTEAHTYVSDGQYVYTDWDENDKRLVNEGDLRFSLYLVPTKEQFKLTRDVLNTYTGSIYDFSNYIEFCKEQKFFQEKYIANCNYIDLILKRSDEEIRAIYYKDGSIRLFYKRGDNHGEAPFTNGAY